MTPKPTATGANSLAPWTNRSRLSRAKLTAGATGRMAMSLAMVRLRMTLPMAAWKCWRAELYTETPWLVSERRTADAALTTELAPVVTVL